MAAAAAAALPDETNAAVSLSPRPDDISDGGRQTRRRWRLFQYLVGWIEMAALGGSSTGGSGVVSAEAEEALAAGVVALVAVTCPGPPPGEEGECFNSGGGGASSRCGGDSGGGGDITANTQSHRRSRRRRQRQFMIETGQAPCPSTPAEAAVVDQLAGVGDSRCPGDDVRGGVADGVWGGVLDKADPSVRQSGGGGGRAGVRVGAGTTKKGAWAADTAAEVWGCWDSAGGRGGDGDVPMYVDFMAATLKECGEWTNGDTQALLV